MDPRKGASALNGYDTRGVRSTILVVEDDTLNANFLDRYLTSIGYQVVRAANGEEGLLKVRREHPDLVLLDIMMPGLNGFEVCQQIRSDSETAHVPILMVTALYETNERVKALEVGADDFLSKPYDIYELGARVKSLLRTKHQRDELERRNELFYSVISRYVSPEVSEQILQDPDRYLKLGGESRLVTTLFADIRGFTRYAQTHSATRVVELLNVVFRELTAVIFKWRGTLDKYMGDALMAIYGAPVSYQDDTLRAIRTALDMQSAFEALRDHWTDQDERGMGLGIGIHSGDAVVGNIGTEMLMNYTVVGDAVNIAQRLEELAQGGQILISQGTLERVKRRASARLYGTQVLRGRQDPTVIYELVDML
jgi:adenylate cyclase